MALDYDKLFSAFGKYVGLSDTLRSVSADTIPANLTALEDEFSALSGEYLRIMSGVQSQTHGFSDSIIAMCNTIKARCDSLLTDREIVLSQLYLPNSSSLLAVLAELSRDMVTHSQQLLKSVVTVGAVTADGTPVGTGAVYVTKVLDGVSIPVVGAMALKELLGADSELCVDAETMWAQCASEGEAIEQFNVGGGQANSGGFDWRRDGSGGPITVPVANATAIVTGKDFITYLSGVPTGWTLGAGTLAGTHIFEQTAGVNVFRGSGSLRIAGNGVLNPIQIYQPLVLGQLVAGKSYSLGIAVKATAATTGTLIAQLGGTGYTPGTLEKISVDLSTASTSWELKHCFINLPLDLPDDLYLEVRVTGPMTTGKDVWVDSLSFAPTSWFGGLGVAIVEGATPFVRGDRWTWPVANDNAGKFGTFFRRGYKLQLPSGGSASTDLDDAKAVSLDSTTGVTPSQGIAQETVDQIDDVSGFVPGGLAGLKVHLEAGDRVTIWCHESAFGGNPCEDGEACLLWEDQTANSLDFAPLTDGPLFQLPQTSEATTPGGQSRLEFNGIDNLLKGAAAADWKFLHDGTGGDLFVVAMTANGENDSVFDTTDQLAGIGVSLYNDDNTVDGRASFAVFDGTGAIVNIQAGNTANVMPVAEWHCLEGNFTGTGAELWVDGCFIGSETSARAASSSNPATAAIIGKQTGAGFAAIRVAAVLAYTRKLTLTEKRQVIGYLSQRYRFPAGNVACIGDSISSGYAAVPTPYPTRLAQILGSMWRVTNFAVSGAVVNEAGATVDMYNDQWITLAKFKRYNWCVCMGGINDIRSTSDSAATIFARYDDMLNEIIAVSGTRLVLCTCIPWKNDTAWTAPKQAVLEAYNTLIRNYATANPTTTYLVDMYDIMGDDADATALRVEYNLDHLHPNQTGADVMAAAVADKLLQIGVL